MRVIYISGPMTGVEEYNYPLFNKVAKQLRDGGVGVVNPAEFFGGKADRTRQEYMRASVEGLLKATDVILLPGWNNSDGAILEVMLAQELGLPVTEYNAS